MAQQGEAHGRDQRLEVKRHFRRSSEALAVSGHGYEAHIGLVFKDIPFVDGGSRLPPGHKSLHGGDIVAPVVGDSFSDAERRSGRSRSAGEVRGGYGGIGRRIHREEMVKDVVARPCEAVFLAAGASLRDGRSRAVFSCGITVGGHFIRHIVTAGRDGLNTVNQNLVPLSPVDALILLRGAHVGERDTLAAIDGLGFSLVFRLAVVVGCGYLEPDAGAVLPGAGPVFPHAGRQGKQPDEAGCNTQ